MRKKISTFALLVVIAVAMVVILSRGYSSTKEPGESRYDAVERPPNVQSSDESPAHTSLKASEHYRGNDDFRLVLDCIEVARYESEIKDSYTYEAYLNSLKNARPSALERANHRLNFYDRHKAKCVGAELANPYDAAILAVENGDAFAAACLLSGSLPEPNDEEITGELALTFPEASRRAIELGIKNGDWNVISAAGTALLAQHGISHEIGMGLSTEDKYMYLMLVSLGTDSPGMLRLYSERMSQLARFIKDDTRHKLDKIARSIFQDSFKGRVTSDGDTVACQPNWI